MSVIQASLFDETSDTTVFKDCTWEEPLPHPRARMTDPSSSHEAAAVTAPGNGELVRVIREVVCWPVALSQFDIAVAVEARFPGRWQSDTVRSACARAGLVACGRDRRDRRWVTRWTWKP